MRFEVAHGHSRDATSAQSIVGNRSTSREAATAIYVTTICYRRFATKERNLKTHALGHITSGSHCDPVAERHPSPLGQLGFRFFPEIAIRLFVERRTACCVLAEWVVFGSHEVGAVREGAADSFAV